MNSISKRRPSTRKAPAGPLPPVSDLLLESLQVLAQTGQTESACRLAGRAYALLRTSQPEIARRFDVFLHRLTPRLTWTDPPQRSDHLGSRNPGVADTHPRSTADDGKPGR